jgi:hypothetical protein
LENSYQPLESNRCTLELSCRARFWTTCQNVEPWWTKQRPTGFCISALACVLLAQLFHVAGHKKVTKKQKHNWYIFDSFLFSGEIYQHQLFEIRILHTIGTYIHTCITFTFTCTFTCACTCTCTLHYITLHCITLHTCIHTYVCFFLFLRGGSKKV